MITVPLNHVQSKGLLTLLCTDGKIEQQFEFPFACHPAGIKSHHVHLLPRWCP